MHTLWFEMGEWKNQLYFGDNLAILRDRIGDESVDLIYLDPPFNSNATYNVLFDARDGEMSSSQITAFEDTWQWGEESAATYHELVTSGPPMLATLLGSLHDFLGNSNMMAYLAMMAARLIELHRVLRDTGSLYLHCDSVASHYLKLLLDAVFGPKQFCREIVWKCTSAHSNAKTYGNIHQNLLFYTKTSSFTFNVQYTPYEQEYIDTYYRYTDEDGRRFMSSDLVGHKGVNKIYEWHGIERPWRYPAERMDELEKTGRIFWTKNGFPRYKRYLDEMPGLPAQTIWTDIQPVVSWSTEGLGYPTQKPEALLRRIILSSSNEEDVVLDPFCGCGTAVVVAEDTARRWIGIDVAYMAIALIRRRLEETFSALSPFDVDGVPKSLQDARAMAHSGPHGRYQFQWWAIDTLGARPANEQRKGPDRGVDGQILFIDDTTGKPKSILVQVKSGKVSRSDVATLVGDMENQGHVIGVLVTLEKPTDKMEKEALAAGFYEGPGFKGRDPVRRVQILTAADLFAGKRVKFYQMGNQTFKEAITKDEKPKLQMRFGE